MSMAAMKMKQTGLAKKSLIVVPNHLLDQFAREFQQLYPNANLLVATKDDLARDRRKLLTAKIASGEWDGIIVTHSSFERIGMSREYQERFLREQIAEYESLLVDKASHGRNIIKTLEKQKANREERLKSLLAEDKKDDGLVFATGFAAAKLIQAQICDDTVDPSVEGALKPEVSDVPVGLQEGFLVNVLGVVLAAG